MLDEILRKIFALKVNKPKGIHIKIMNQQVHNFEAYHSSRFYLIIQQFVGRVAQSV